MLSTPLLKYGHGLAQRLAHLLDLFYPRLCLACGRHLPPHEEHLCLFCQHKLPLTDYHLIADNPFIARFWGRIPLHAGTSLYHFAKGGRVQQLIHQLKYHHKTQIGYQLGKLHGKALLTSPLYAGVDLIVPVPLHPKKQHRRGYNQSDYYAQGLAASMGIPWSAKVLSRKNDTVTQTQKARLDRFENVETVFELQNPDEIANRHILLVDDVITTGATLEACGLQLLQPANVRLSMATIAFAN